MNPVFTFSTYRQRPTFHPKPLVTSPYEHYVASLRIKNVPNETYTAAALQVWLRENGPDFGPIIDLQVLMYADGKCSNHSRRPDKTVAFLTYQSNRSHAFAWAQFNGQSFRGCRLQFFPHGFSSDEMNRRPHRYSDTTPLDWFLWCQSNDFGPQGPGSFARLADWNGRADAQSVANEAGERKDSESQAAPGRESESDPDESGEEKSALSENEWAEKDAVESQAKPITVAGSLPDNGPSDERVMSDEALDSEVWSPSIVTTPVAEPAKEFLSPEQVKEFLVGTKMRFEHLANMAAGSAQDVEAVLTRLGL